MSDEPVGGRVEPGAHVGARVRRHLVLIALASLTIAIGLSLRSAPVASDIDIVFQQASLHSVDGRLLLDAQADIQLPQEVRQGLDSGVPLDFIVELSVHEPRRFIPDPKRLAGQWRFRLVYYELTRHYRLGSSDTGSARNYRSVLTALDALGKLRDLDIGTGTLPATGRDQSDADAGAWQATLDMRLDTRGLPLPLQPLIGTSWRMRSAPFSWRVIS